MWRSYLHRNNMAGYTGSPVPFGRAGAVLKVTRAFWQEQWGQRLQKKVKRWVEGRSKLCMQQKTEIGKFVMEFVKCQWSIGKWMLPLLPNLTGLVDAVYQALMLCNTFILLFWSHLHIVDFILSYEKLWLNDKWLTPKQKTILMHR